MLDIKKECTGCMACVNSCAAGAMKIKENEYGFVMPVIDMEMCVGCGACEEVCPIVTFPEGTDNVRNDVSGAEEILETQKGDNKILGAWSMFHKSPEVVKKSSSGGAFYGLAEKVLQNGGIVFGCNYDIKEKKAVLSDTDKLPLNALLTSKYVESYIGEDGMKRVEAEVLSGRQVLFCGTPCQAAGLRSFLGRDYDNLVIVDFACGGVAAQPYLKNYLESLEAEYGSKLKEISFRDKHYGWGQYCFTAEFENGRIYRKTAMSDPYFFCFLRSSMQRLSCHGCHFSADHRSDICLSDFWKCDHFEVDGNERKGLSLVLAFTEKGKAAVTGLLDSMNMEELPLDMASYNLKSRFCPQSKLEEIYRDMSMALNDGVAALRNFLLTEEEKKFYEERQRIMDDEKEAALHPDIVGKGQIM